MAKRFIQRMLMALVVLLAGTAGALAHASLLSSAPVADEVLSQAPAAVTLTFNEPVGVLAAVLAGPDGETRDLLAGATGGGTVIVALPHDLGRGTQVLSWRVASEDGHPVAGTLVFSIGAITGSAAPATTDGAVAFAVWLVRAAVYAGLFFGAGTLAFVLIGPLPPAARRLGVLLCAAGAVAALLAIDLQGVDGAGLPLGGLLDPRAWSTGWSTSLASSMVVAAGAMAIACLTLVPHRTVARSAAVAALAGMGLSLALSGHASAASPPWLTRPAVFVHAVTVAFWCGALLPLLLLMRRQTPAGEAALQRFSALIPFALGPLVVAGAVLAAVQLGWPGPAWLAPYAGILAAKLAAVAALLALAAFNRWRLTRPVLAGDGDARRRFGLSVRAEIVLVVVVLGLVAGWRFTPPPRVIAEALAAPLEVHLHSDALIAQLTLSPGHPGPVDISAYLTDGEFGPVAPLSVTLAFTQEAAGIGPISAAASLGEDGFWHATGVMLPAGGAWSVRLSARTGKFELRSVSGTIDLR